MFLGLHQFLLDLHEHEELLLWDQPYVPQQLYYAHSHLNIHNSGHETPHPLITYNSFSPYVLNHYQPSIAFLVVEILKYR